MKEKDDFWDIESLLPPKRKTAIRSTPPAVSPVPIVLDAKTDKIVESRKISFASGEKELFKDYVPLWNPMIHRIRIYREKNTYKLYHIFLSDAVRYLDEKGEACPFVPAYSYIPQYSQLNAAQRAYYFYFRDEANRGNYIKTNQSYFLLYVYEILNLPEYIPPKIGIVRMAKAWRAYRNQLPELDNFMAGWLSDYAFLHELALPEDVLAPFLKDILSHSMLKEFYLGGSGTISDCRLDAFLALSSDYDYKRGRYASGEDKELFLGHVQRASRIAVDAILQKEAKESTFQTVLKRYPAYIGAFCAQPYRFTVEVSYCSVSGTEALRTLVTSLVKYAENKVRAALSIKSRLSVPGLSPLYKELIDEYFKNNFAPVKKAVKGEAIVPEYEKMYDPLSHGFSSDEAKSIEESSWENTRILIPEEEAEAFEEKKEAPAPHADTPLATIDMEFLATLLCKGEAAARMLVRQNGCLLENVVERINEYFADTLGDIVIELLDDAVCLIEDYETEVMAFLAPYENNGTK